MNVDAGCPKKNRSTMAYLSPEEVLAVLKAAAGTPFAIGR
jgi:hypothetical protein